MLINRIRMFIEANLKGWSTIPTTRSAEIQGSPHAQHGRHNRVVRKTVAASTFPAIHRHTPKWRNLGGTRYFLLLDFVCRRKLFLKSQNGVAS